DIRRRPVNVLTGQQAVLARHEVGNAACRHVHGGWIDARHALLGQPGSTLGQVQVAVSGDSPVRHGEAAGVEVVDVASACDEIFIEGYGPVRAIDGDEIRVRLG